MFKSIKYLVILLLVCSCSNDIPSYDNWVEILDNAINLHAIGDPLIIPQHYDMFTFNTADVSDFASKAKANGQAYQVMQCGEKFIWSK